MRAELAEIRRQFLLFGNQVKGIQLIANLVHGHPYDRHLHKTLGETLLLLLKNRPGPWLPDLAALPFPTNILARLRAVRSRPPQAGVGEILCLLVNDEDSAAVGFLRLLRCQFTNFDRSPKFPQGSGPAMQSALSAAEEVAFSYLTDTYRFLPRTDAVPAFEIVGDPPYLHLREEFDGRSIGAAAALSVLSLATQTPVPIDVAVTGALEGMEIIRVEGVKEKVEAVLRERPDVTRLFIPQGNKDDLSPELLAKVECVQRFDELVEKVFGNRLAMRLRKKLLDFGKPIQNAQEAYDRQEYSQALRGFRAVRKCLPESSEFDLYRYICLWRIASIGTHRGDVRVAQSLPTVLARVDELWQDKDLSSPQCLNVHVTSAVQLTDLYRYQEVEKELLDNPVTRAGLLEDKFAEVKRLNSLGQLYLFWHRLPQAEAAFLAAGRLLETLPDPGRKQRSLPRYHTYLMRLYTETKDFSKAVEHHTRGAALITQLDRGGGPDELFLRTYGSRLFYRQGDYVQSIAEAERAVEIARTQQQVYPACIARRHQGLSLLGLGKEAEGQAILRAEKEPPDFSALDWPSLNIRVIRDVSVIELALHLLRINDGKEKEIRSLLRHVLTGLKKFSLAHHFFKNDIARLQRHLAAKKLNPSVLQKHLATLRDKIHT